MPLIVLAADKGAPGVTTAAVAVAAVWPGRCVLAECDPAGSDLPYRLPAAGGRPLGQDRGIVSLAAAVRAQVGPQVVWEHTQTLEGGLPVLVGPAGPEQAAAMGSAWTPISGLLAGLGDADVVADCGRILGETPLSPLLRRADLIVLVARDTVDGVAHLRHGLVAIARAANTGGGSALGRIGVLVVAGRRARAAGREVGRVLGATPGLGEVPVLGVLPWDEAGAAGLCGQSGRRVDRSRLAAAARSVAQDLHARTQPASVVVAGRG